MSTPQHLILAGCSGLPAMWVAADLIASSGLSAAPAPSFGELESPASLTLVRTVSRIQCLSFS